MPFVTLEAQDVVAIWTWSIYDVLRGKEEFPAAAVDLLQPRRLNGHVLDLELVEFCQQIFRSDSSQELFSKRGTAVHLWAAKTVLCDLPTFYVVCNVIQQTVGMEPMVAGQFL